MTTRFGDYTFLAQQEDAAAVIPNQKLAIEQLKELALKGNADAETALLLMKQKPFLHPLLKRIAHGLIRSFSFFC